MALPALMEDLVRRACLAGGTIEVEVSVDSIDDLRAELSRRRVDAVIAAKAPNEMSLIPLAALQVQPTLRVVLITTDSGVGDLIELRPQWTHLGEMTVSEIVHVVDDDAAHARSWAHLAGNRVTGTWWVYTALREAELLALRHHLTRLEGVAPVDLVVAIRLAPASATTWIA